MKLYKIIKYLQSAEAYGINDSEKVMVSDLSRDKLYYELPNFSSIIEISEAVHYIPLTHADKLEIDKVGESWKNRFIYRVSFNWGSDWWHLFVDFDKEEKRNRSGVLVAASNNWQPNYCKEPLLTYPQNKLSLDIPEKFHKVEYNLARIPGCEAQENLALKANCQVYVYELLKSFGKQSLQLRSKELWEDIQVTQQVKEENLQPLDIMLYNNKEEAFGAHIGVYIGDGKVLHLSQGNNIPMIEEHKSMITKKSILTLLVQNEYYNC
ncbi:MAG: C40 family peptidase [Cytophagales bacterium]|nr:C40 family peptidase [Cytophagales bacterium]